MNRAFLATVFVPVSMSVAVFAFTASDGILTAWTDIFCTATLAGVCILQGYRVGHESQREWKRREERRRREWENEYWREFRGEFRVGTTTYPSETRTDYVDRMMATGLAPKSLFCPLCDATYDFTVARHWGEARRFDARCKNKACKKMPLAPIPTPVSERRAVVISSSNGWGFVIPRTVAVSGSGGTDTIRWFPPTVRGFTADVDMEGLLNDDSDNIK